MIVRKISIILLALTACGKGYSPPQKPQIEVYPQAIDFGRSQGFGVYVGTLRKQGVQIRNGGIDDLVISLADLSGDSEFSLAGPLSNRVIGQKSTFMEVTFTPSSGRVFNAGITINSNANNASVVQIPISGLGVVGPDGGP